MKSSNDQRLRILFICNQGKHRSRTAELLFNNEFQTRSAGLFSETRRVQKEDLLWADTVFVMEEFQREEIARRFPKEYLLKRILCLNIPDQFSFGQAELKDLLKTRFAQLTAQLVKLK